MTDTYRVVNGPIVHADGVYEDGDEFEPSESTIRALYERQSVIEPVDGDEDTNVESADEGDEDEDEEPEPIEATPSVADEAQAAGDASEASADGDGADADAEDELDYDSLTVSELEGALDEHEFSQEELQDLLEYEQENKDRSGAKSAIESRLDEDDSE